MKAGVILGEKNGIIKGQAKMLIQLLDKKFGEVNKATRDMIYELDEEELWDCVNRLQFAQSLDDVVRHIF